MTPLGRRSKSSADRSRTGTASAADSVCARSAGEMLVVAIRLLTKVRFCSLAARASASATLASSLPALTSTRATPVRVRGGSACDESTMYCVQSGMPRDSSRHIALPRLNHAPPAPLEPADKRVEGPPNRDTLLGTPPSVGLAGLDANQDRKSTRLNSSHVKISYAVFCL